MRKGVFLLAILMSISAWGKGQSIVVTHHPLATRAGEKMFELGGNAFDAFVAATVAEYVVGEGVTSASGPLNALVYDARARQVLHLDGTYNNVKDPAGRWDGNVRTPGKALLVPGAIAALEELSRRFGRLPFATCLEPALSLARDGFGVTDIYARLVLYGGKEPVLKKTDYGRSTYFPGGVPLKEGALLKLPEVARFLTRLQRNGSAHMYRGDWAKKYVALARSLGGKLTLKDMASYRPQWIEPLKISYRGHEIYDLGGRSLGGAWTLLALKVFEHTAVGKVHFSESPDVLEKMVRTSREVWRTDWLRDVSFLDDPFKVSERLSDDRTISSIWRRVEARESSGADTPHRGSHSYHIIVIDDEGNAVTGTNTINSMPWGEGYFVEGIPIHDSGKHSDSTFYGGAGERVINPNSMSLVFRDGRLRFATGAFGMGLLEASFQFLVNLIDYGLDARKATHLPRFGGEVPRVSPTRNYLSPRIAENVVEDLALRKVLFESNGAWIDTGLGTVAVLHEDGSLEGDVTPLDGR